MPDAIGLVDLDSHCTMYTCSLICKKTKICLALSLAYPLLASSTATYGLSSLSSTSPHHLSQRIVYNTLLPVQVYRLHSHVWPCFVIPILLLTTCFPLSSHPPSSSSCVNLVLLTSGSPALPTLAPPSHLHMHTLPIFLMPVPITPCCELALPVSPCSWPVLSSTCVHNLHIFLMPAFPHPACLAHLSPCLAALPSPLLNFPPLASPTPAASPSSTSPCPSWSLRAQRNSGILDTPKHHHGHHWRAHQRMQRRPHACTHRRHSATCTCVPR